MSRAGLKLFAMGLSAAALQLTVCDRGAVNEVWFELRCHIALSTGDTKLTAQLIDEATHRHESRTIIRCGRGS